MSTNPWINLVAGILIGWLLGWLAELIFFRNRHESAIGAQWQSQVDRLNAELRKTAQDFEQAKQQAATLESELTDLRSQVSTQESELTEQRALMAASPRGPIVDLQLASELPAEPEDLRALEGIGPTYATRLNQAGITNYARLARVTPAWLDELVKAPDWRRPNYEDWLAQARLAAVGDTEALQALQAELFAKREDNLLLLHGVGPKAAEALHRAGITTFAALAATPSERLAEIVQEAGLRGVDVDVWITEAALRAEGKRVPRPQKSRGERVAACPQDLSRVDGIGPALETKLYEAGIGSYWELGTLEDADLARILEMDPASHENLSTIKESALALARETGTENLKWDGTPPDDLESLPGIGEMFERRLYEAGICTFAALAAATVEQLAAIVQAPPSLSPNFEEWIAQARARAQ